jgi:DNA-binding transcriptional ArsR family regulator
MENRGLNIKQEINIILAAFRQFKDGASIEEIKYASGLDIELRTLQRRLKRLQEQGFVTLSGRSTSARYYLVQKEENQIASDRKDIIPLSDAGRNVLDQVSLPLRQRDFIGYQRHFLEIYKPNNDFYLSDGEKEKLALIGKTSMPDQPAGTYAKEILHRLLIDLSWNSSRLEGNTYSLLDTERLISLGETADDKSALEAQMILNHKDAIEFIVQAADGIGFNRYTILNLHALLSNNLLPNSAASGRLRSIAVGINQSTYTPPAIPQLIEEMFDLMLKKADQIQNPFEQAFFIMVHLPYLQPFDDVNKRVSRLAANIPLIKHNLAPLSFIDVPGEPYIKGLLGVYELNKFALLKDVFLWAYERSAARYAVVRQTLGEPDPFRLKYRDAMRKIISEIVSQALTQTEASIIIKKRATQIAEVDQPKFIEAVETELLSLHEGNFARYYISPSQFARWKAVW